MIFESVEQPFIEAAMVMITVLGLALNLLLCCCKRLANLLIYYELLYFLFQSLIPYDFGDFMHFVNLSSILLIYLTVATNPGQGTIACTICMLLTELCLMPLMYFNFDESSEQPDFFYLAILYSILCFMSLTFASMLIAYVAKNRARDF